MWIEPAKAS